MKLAPDELELLKQRESLPRFKFKSTETGTVITHQILSDTGKLCEYSHTINKDDVIKFKNIANSFKIKNDAVSLHSQFDGGVGYSHIFESFKTTKTPLPLSERIYDFMQKLSKYKYLTKIVKYYNRRITNKRTAEHKIDIETVENTIKTLTNGDNNICNIIVDKYGMIKGTQINLTDLKSSDMMIVYDYDTDESVEVSVDDLIATFGDISRPTVVNKQPKLYIGTDFNP
jgi:hypothetical protein